MPNIKNPAFNYEAAMILMSACEHFPALVGWAHDEDNEFYPTETGQSRRDIQFETVRWLSEHGYLQDEFGFVGGEWKEGFQADGEGIARPSESSILARRKGDRRCPVEKCDCERLDRNLEDHRSARVI